MSVCLILIMAGKTLLPIPAPFPDQVACEMGGASMVDGKTVRGYVCVPITIYDCTQQKGRPESERPSSFR